MHRAGLLPSGTQANEDAEMRMRPVWALVQQMPRPAAQAYSPGFARLPHGFARCHSWDLRGVIPTSRESDRKHFVCGSKGIATQARHGRTGGYQHGLGQSARTSLLLDPKKSSVQPVAETLWKFDRLFVAQQLHNILHAVVDSSAVPASIKMVLDPDSQFRREIALEIIRQLPAYLIAVDFYGP